MRYELVRFFVLENLFAYAFFRLLTTHNAHTHTSGDYYYFELIRIPSIILILPFHSFRFYFQHYFYYARVFILLRYYLLMPCSLCMWSLNSFVTFCYFVSLWFYVDGCVLAATTFSNRLAVLRFSILLLDFCFSWGVPFVSVSLSFWMLCVKAWTLGVVGEV